MGYLKYIIKGLNPRKFYYISLLSLKDIFKGKGKSFSNDVHIRAAMEWLSTAQKQNGDGGVSALYSLFDGWASSYVETTGYIIPTFFNYAKILKNDIYKEKAIQMADFELISQLPSGAFPGGGIKKNPIVFNTGQVIFGLCRAFQETNDEKYKKSAIKAADWLVSIQAEEGYWDKFTYLNNIHTYNTRTAWSLLKVHEITKEKRYKEAAIKNIDWALTQQLPNGWFKKNAFHETQEPVTHTIAYSVRGILESGIYLKNKRYVNAAKKTTDVLMRLQRKDGSFAGSYNHNWKTNVSWSCLTGNSQISIILFKIYSETKDNKYLQSAKKANMYLKATQNLRSSNPAFRGAIKGAFPIYGWYAPFCFPNWAAKFFIDALMIEKDIRIGNQLS